MESIKELMLVLLGLLSAATGVLIVYAIYGVRQIATKAEAARKGKNNKRS